MQTSLKFQINHVHAFESFELIKPFEPPMIKFGKSKDIFNKLNRKMNNECDEKLTSIH